MSGSGPLPRKPLLQTGRLELWRPCAADREGLLAMVQPEAVRRHLGPNDASPSDSFARLLRNAGSWALYGYGAFAVREAGRSGIVGSCGVFHSWRGFGRGMDDVPEAGWIIAEPYWGKGYACEAMAAALAWFDATHAATRTVCMIEQGNAVSEKVAAKLGYRAYDRHEPNDGPPLTLYERRIAA